MTRIDWKEIESAAVTQILTAVCAVGKSHPSESIYGAMFHESYGDGSVIFWPILTVGTQESLNEVVAGYVAKFGEEEALEASLRWSGADLLHSFDPGTFEQALADTVHGAASSSGDFEEWKRAYERFLRCFPKAAKQARRQLIAQATVSTDFIAVSTDEAGELVPLSLTKAQLLTHFPQYDVAERERRRLAALPVTKRVEELLPEVVTPTYKGPLVGEHEKLLVDCGVSALHALVSVLRGERYASGAPGAARILAEINIDTSEVVEALDDLMRRKDGELNARAWAASALARLGRSDLILASVPELPTDVVTRGICDPLRSFRDYGAHRALDYGPLEEVLDQYPSLEPAFEKELAPGVGFCSPETDEIPVVSAALGSPWNVVRTHARIVLESAGKF